MKTCWTLVIFLFVLAGCNTINGVGKDIKSAGQTIEDAAKKK